MTRKNGNGGDRGITIALLYVRVSSDEQAKEGLSLPAQLKACRQYTADHGWVIGGEYEDVLSGKRDDRPQYQELLSEARRLASEDRSVAVVVMRLDRFGRRLAERIRSRDEFKKVGVETHSVREGGHVNDLMANMLAVLAEEEVTRLGERVRDTREHVEANGWKAPGRPAWGYRFRPANTDERAQGAPKSVLAVDEQTAPYAREAFRKIADGQMAPRSLAIWAASLPAEARGEQISEEEARAARRLHPRAVRMMLTAPVYIGRFADGTQGRWEPLIDMATWDAVQARLAARAGVRGPSGGEYLLTGLLRCPECGSRMGGWTKNLWRRYRCSAFMKNGQRSVRECAKSITGKPLDADVLAQVNAVLAPLAEQDANLTRALTRTWEALRRPNDQQARQRQHLIAKAQKDADDARRRIANATRLLIDGTIDKVAYDALVADEQRRLNSAEEALAAPTIQTGAALPPLADVLAQVGGWTTVLSDGPIPEQRTVLMMLIECIVPRRVSFGRYTAEITWTELGKALQEVPVVA